MAVARSDGPPGGAPIDAQSIVEVVKALHRRKVDFLIIGNSGALLHGAPVVTADVDVFVRRAPVTLQKITATLRDLGFPRFPSSLLEESRFCEFERPDLRLDIIFAPAGIRSFESARSRRVGVKVGGTVAWVAALEDIIASKAAADRAKDRTFLPLLRAALALQKPKPSPPNVP